MPGPADYFRLDGYGSYLLLCMYDHVILVGKKNPDVPKMKYLYFEETITLPIIFICFTLFMTDVENDIQKYL